MSGNTAGLLGLVTSAEAARLLGVSTAAIRQRIMRYRIPVIYVGSSLLVSLGDLKATYRVSGGQTAHRALEVSA